MHLSLFFNNFSPQTCENGTLYIIIHAMSHFEEERSMLLNRDNKENRQVVLTIQEVGS